MSTAEPARRKDEILQRGKATIQLVDPLFHLERKKRNEGGRERGREG